VHPGDGKWFQGYEQQEVMLLDEIDKWCQKDRDHPSGLGYAMVLKLLDRGPLEVETKGGSEKVNSPFIFCTSTVHPDQWFPETGSVKNQVERRIHECYTRDSEDEPWVSMPMWKPVKKEKKKGDTRAEPMDISDEEPEDIPLNQLALYADSQDDSLYM